MENLCNNCIHKDVCGRYAATWGMKSCEHHKEERKGEWLYDSGSGKFFCYACGEYALSFKKDTLYGGDLYEACLTDYCPNCGADMRGTEDG